MGEQVQINGKEIDGHVHFSTIPCEPNKANIFAKICHMFAKFVPVRTALRLPGLKFLELLCEFFRFPCTKIMGKCNSRPFFRTVN